MKVEPRAREGREPLSGHSSTWNLTHASLGVLSINLTHSNHRDHSNSPANHIVGRYHSSKQSETLMTTGTRRSKIISPIRILWRGTLPSTSARASGSEPQTWSVLGAVGSATQQGLQLSVMHTPRALCPPSYLPSAQAGQQALIRQTDLPVTTGTGGRGRWKDKQSFEGKTPVSCFINHHHA